MRKWRGQEWAVLATLSLGFFREPQPDVTWIT
jgi:hypothetical protein